MNADREVLILHLPVIHQGYLKLLEKYRRQQRRVYLLNQSLIKQLSDYEPDIASLKPKTVKILLAKMGFRKIEILTPAKIKNLRIKKLHLVNEEISRRLKEKYFPKLRVSWLKVFLRWDRKKVISSALPKVPISRNKLTQKIIKLAYQEAKKSSDWWRQVGAVLVKREKIILTAYNRSLPSDHSPYLHGGIRDFLAVGERPELSPTIHSEQIIVAEAAKKGISLQGATLYVTHFPCSVCAKLLAVSGIKKLCFAEGSSNLQALQVLKAARVTLAGARKPSHI